MSDTSIRLGISRRNLLTGLLPTPVLAATVGPSIAQINGPHWTPQQAQAALKNGKDTKLVLLGTAAGSSAGPLARNDFTCDAEQRRSVCA
jgi:hypothetical protein